MLFGSFQQTRLVHRQTINVRSDHSRFGNLNQTFPQFSLWMKFPLPTIGSSVSLSRCTENSCMTLSATSHAIGVLIADSNRMQAQLLTTALRRHPEFSISTCPLDERSIEQVVRADLPRIALLSLSAHAKKTQTFTIVRQLQLAHPGIAKILLVDSYDRELVVSAFRGGVRGIFSVEHSDLRLLCKCILRVSEGQIWANTEQLDFLLDQISEVPSLRVLNVNSNRLLTPREEQVVALVAEGLGNRQIAVELN